MGNSFSRRDRPPRHAICNETCWRWMYDFGEDEGISTPYRICNCDIPSRADIFRYIIVNYIARRPEEDLPGGGMYQTWRNCLLVCVDWADVLLQKMFEDPDFSLDSEADLNDALFMFQVLVRHPHRLTLVDYRMKIRTMCESVCAFAGHDSIKKALCIQVPLRHCHGTIPGFVHYDQGENMAGCISGRIQTPIPSWITPITPLLRRPHSLQRFGHTLAAMFVKQKVPGISLWSALIGREAVECQWLAAGGKY